MRAVSTLGFQIQATTIGWQVYELARDSGRSVADSAFLLGLVGLAQFLPLLLLSPFGGQAADRWNRKRILQAYQAAKIVTLLALAATSALASDAALIAVFCAAVVSGAVNAFAPSASQALLPGLVPREELPQAVAISSLAFSTASIVGPSLAGAAIALGEGTTFGGATIAYGLAGAFFILGFCVCALIRPPPQEPPANSNALVMIREGFVYVWRNKIVLGAISLDLVAVLLAGATALLPVYARDILHVGPEGLGIMRAAGSAGAALVAVILAAAPLQRRVGPWMFAAVGVFGLATLLFGLSTVFWLSVVALFLIGASDMVSVYVRSSLIQLATPDAMRGRVASTSFIFISASNELGEFQSGVAARFLGPVGAVVLGGIGAVICSGLWIKIFPQLWRMDSFEDALAFAETPPRAAAQTASPA
ncbi:MAG: MFS transporter [Alphaproteobacteria bacterium]|nr:MFS transporter [Alphaproteobacteria bacterium]